MPVPCLTDVWTFVNDFIKLVGIPFQLNHVAKHKCEAAEYLSAYPKHNIFRAEGHIFRSERLRQTVIANLLNVHKPFDILSAGIEGMCNRWDVDSRLMIRWSPMVFTRLCHHPWHGCHKLTDRMGDKNKPPLWVKFLWDELLSNMTFVLNKFLCFLRLIRVIYWLFFCEMRPWLQWQSVECLDSSAVYH